MSNNQGIFQAVSGQQPISPFAPVAQGAAQPSPFMAVDKSPFVLVDETNGSRPVEPGKPAKLPEKRAKSDSPFQLADDGSPVGFEPVVVSTFDPSAPSSPFALAPAASPAPAPQPQGFANPGYQATSPFGAWTPPQTSAPQQPAPQFQPQPFSSGPSAFAPVQAPVAPPAAPPVMMSPPPAPAPVAMPEADSASIRQIELRAIFGVDREMSHEEILQRARALPGIRHVARVDAQHMGALDGLRQVLAGLGFGTGGLRIYCGSSPVEFIREGAIILAAQTDGGFAPGVRETLMIVARELSR